MILAAALLFSTGGAAIKATTLTSGQVACFRSLVAAVALSLMIPVARRGWSWKLVPAGMAYALTLALFVHATKRTTSANAIFLQSTAPLYLIFLGPWLLREHPPRSDYVLGVVLAIGLAMFFVGTDAATATAPDPLTGNVLAATTGITWAFTVVALRKASGHQGGENTGMRVVALGNALACAISLPLAFPVEHVALTDVAVVTYLGVVQIGVAYWLLTAGMTHVPAFETSTLILAEPALNPVWTWLVHGERPGALSAAGGALILIATFVNAWWKRKEA